MKRSVFAATLLVLSTLALMAQVQQPKVNVSQVKVTGQRRAENYAEIKFDTLHHHFGTFSQKASKQTCEFPFENTGTAPLIIHQAFASCGCTVPQFGKRPIKPGERDTIRVTYNGKGRLPGHFMKTVTVRCNARTEIVRLVIEGEMLE